MDLHHRFRRIISEKKLSNRAFAIKCGVSQPTFDKQIRGLRPISSEVIISTLSAFPDISAEWLLRGEGEMLKASAPDSVLGISLDTIESLNRTIKTKDENIEILVNRVKELENQLKNK